jgi:hypothetical protein
MTVENDLAILTMAERAPAQTFAFQAGRLPTSAFLGAPYQIAVLVNAVEADNGAAASDETMAFPTEEEIADAIARASATLEFDLQAELFDLLGDEYVAFTTFPRLAFNDFGIEAAAAFTATDPVALGETMAKFAAWLDRSDSGIDVSTRQVAGSRVFVASGQDSEGLFGLEFGVVQDEAVVGIGGGIDALTTKPAPSLADDEQFQMVMGLLPGAYYEVAYVDLRAAIEPIMSLIAFVKSMNPDWAGATEMPETQGGNPGNVRAIGSVSFQDGNVSGVSAILYIAST